MLAALRDRVMLPDGSLIPWAQPGRHAAADRRRGAGDPVDRPRQRRRAERPRVLNRDHTAFGRHRPGRRREGLRRQRDLRRGPVRRPARASRPASRSSPAARWASSPRAASTPRPTSPAGSRAPAPASPTTTPPPRRSSTRSPAFTPPTTCPPTAAAAALPRLRAHRRPLPGRRGPALRQPHREALSRPPDRDPARRLRPPAGLERAGAAPTAAALDPPLVRPLPARSRRCASHRVSPPSSRPVPREAPSGRRYRAARFADLARGMVRIRGKRPQMVSSTGIDAAGGARSTRSAAWATAARSSAPGSPEGSRVVFARGPAQATADADRLADDPCTARDLRCGAVEHADRGAPLRCCPRRHEAARRPRPLPAGRAGPRAVWQLHPAAWKFDRGHTIELQLLGADPPYSRPVELRLRDRSSALCACAFRSAAS